MGLLNKKEKKAKKSKKPFRIENLYSMREIDEDEFKQPPKPDPLWEITPVKIKDLEIGKGKPVICLSIAGETVDDISRQTKKAAESEADLIEWRADKFEAAANPYAVAAAAGMVKAEAGDKAILFTMRTSEEGGMVDLTAEEYEKVNAAVIDNEAADIIDLQTISFGEASDRLLKAAAENDIVTIASYHDFEQTPQEDEIIDILRGLQYSGADIVKLAVMPHDEDDVMALINASIKMNNRYADRPHINISMSRLGAISRISAEFINSAIVYASENESLAPGQLKVEKMKILLNGVHERI